MKAAGRRRRPRLSPSEGVLLRAATAPAPVAQAAWKRWRESQEIEDAGPRSLALFAMVHGHLGAELDGADAIRLRGVYKRTWYANQLLLSNVPSLADALAAREVPALLLNDAALVAGHYPDLGHRAIRSVDLLVPDAKRARALAAVAELAWRPEESASFASPGSLSMAAFTSAESQRLKVWTHLLSAEPQEDTEARIWSEARSVSINGGPISSLGPIEQLLCLAADAFRDEDLSLSRYADASRLVGELRSVSDWTDLVWRAQRYEHVLPLRNLLAFLEEALAVPLPEWVLPVLHGMAISHGELIRYPDACEGLLLRAKSWCLRRGLYP